MSTQGESSGAFDPVEALRAEIVAQTEAVRADEQQKQAVESVLLDLHRRIERLETAHRGDRKHVAERLHAISTAVIGIALEVRTIYELLVEMMARAWGMDRKELSKLRQQATDAAFEKLSRDGLNIEVQAGQSAQLAVSNDKVGRDKSEQG